MKKAMRKMASVALALVFFLNTSYAAADISHLATGTPFPQESPEGAIKPDIAILREADLITTALEIARLVLVDEKDRAHSGDIPFDQTVRTSLRRGRLRNSPRLLGLIPGISNVCREDNDIVVRFRIVHNRKLYEVRICKKDDFAKTEEPEEGWGFTRKFAMQARNLESAPDIRGAESIDTDPVIKHHIESSTQSYVEIFFDKEKERLRAFEVVHCENYKPGETPEEEYLGEELDIAELFTDRQMQNMYTWITNPDHRLNEEISKRGSLVRFRMAIGQGALFWHVDFNHSNVAHASRHDGVINLGEYFLRLIFSDSLYNEKMRHIVLDEDELQHLYGNDHAQNDPAYLLRREKARTVIEYIEKVKEAMLKKDWKFLLYELKEALDRAKAGDEIRLINFLTVSNYVSVNQRKYPLESRWPLLFAVALLNPEEQKELVSILNNDANRHLRARLVIIDTILLMLEDEIPKNWIDMWAPNVRGRGVYQFASEIWNPGGGLGQVLQFEGVEMQRFLATIGQSLSQVEPRYIFAKAKNGDVVKIDYAKLLGIEEEDIVEVARFQTHVNSRAIGPKLTEAICYRAINRYGIVCYFIADKEGYYTNRMYDYRPRGNPADWEEFSEFISKAADELARTREEEARTAEGTRDAWRAPIIHFNDAQFAPAIAYARKYYADSLVLGKAVRVVSGHTYKNRQIYGLQQGKDALYRLELADAIDFYTRTLGAPLVDMSTGLIRMSDGFAFYVSGKQLDDLHEYDKWDDPSFPEQVAIANPDLREVTAVYFRKNLLSIYHGADVNNPTPDQVLMTKRKCKVLLGQRFEEVISPEQFLITYTGRGVEEKIDFNRAFTMANVDQLVRMGVQIVIGTNAQCEPEVAEKLKHLQDEIAQKKVHTPNYYPGNFIWHQHITPDDQRAILAAADAVVLMSKEKTEAAGFTEVDGNVCAALAIVPEKREGLLQAQGIPVNFTIPGEGNTLIPKDGSEEAFRELLVTAFSRKPEELAAYQATSVRLSRILDARLTAAERLRYYSRATAWKEKELAKKAKEAQLAVAGTIRNGLIDFINNFGGKSATLNEIVEAFKASRDSKNASERTIRRELDGLVRLGILTVRTELLPRTHNVWQLDKGIQYLAYSLPMRDATDFREHLAALPGLDCPRISRNDVKDIKPAVDRLVARYAVKCARHSYRYLQIYVDDEGIDATLRDGKRETLFASTHTWESGGYAPITVQGFLSPLEETLKALLGKSKLKLDQINNVQVCNLRGVIQHSDAGLSAAISNLLSNMGFENFRVNTTQSDLDYSRYSPPARELLEYEASRSPNFRFATEKHKMRNIEETMEAIHEKDKSLVPPMKDKTTMWHVFPVELIPVSIRGNFIKLVGQINDIPNQREKIRIVTEEQSLEAVLHELAGNANNIVDVALTRAEDLKILPDNVLALIFKGRAGDFRQLEAMLAGLRALQVVAALKDTRPQDALRAAGILLELRYMLTGTEGTENAEFILNNINNPKKLARAIIFFLVPIEIYDHNEIPRLNRALLPKIYSA